MPSKPPARPRKSLDAPVAELLLAMGQLLRRLRAEASPGDMSWSQVATLSRLAKTGAMTTADLARAEQVKPQSMGVLLAELEQEQLVERTPHPTDGRQILFALTAEGVQACRQRSVAKRAWLMAAVAQLDPQEQDALVAVIPLIKRLGEA